jgi:hypothetical protein
MQTHSLACSIIWSVHGFSALSALPGFTSLKRAIANSNTAQILLATSCLLTALNSSTARFRWSLDICSKTLLISSIGCNERIRSTPVTLCEPLEYTRSVFAYQQTSNERANDVSVSLPRPVERPHHDNGSTTHAKPGTLAMITAVRSTNVTPTNSLQGRPLTRCQSECVRV